MSNFHQDICSVVRLYGPDMGRSHPIVFYMYGNLKFLGVVPVVNCPQCPPGGTVTIVYRYCM